MERNEIQAMISLLEDTDREVFNTVSDNLMQQGVGIIPELEKAWEETLDEKLQTRLENIIQEIQFNGIKNDLINWKNAGAEYILDGAIHVARFQFPELQTSKIHEEVERIRQDIWIEIHPKLTALEKVKILNYVMFDVYKFARNHTDFYSPQNSYINQVFETRKGNPISLAIVYLSLAARLDLPIYGVNLPKNFILAYKDEFRYHDSENETEDILFYINPYNRGALLGRKEIDYFIAQQQIKPHPSFYIPCTNLDIITRLINNLILSFEKLGYTQKISRMKALLRIIENEQ
jgi:hypothetical protein